MRRPRGSAPLSAGAAAAHEAEGRFTACAVEGGPGNATMAIASIYLDPTAAAEEEHDARIIHALAWARGLGHGCWAIAGDWNRHPSLLRHDLLSQMGAAVVAPAAPTCHSSNGPPSCIDWWVVGPDLAARSPAADVWDETGLPTHRPVELRISGPQRSLEITALRQPVALPPPDKPTTDKETATREGVTA